MGWWWCTYGCGGRVDGVVVYSFFSSLLLLDVCIRVVDLLGVCYWIYWINCIVAVMIFSFWSSIRYKVNVCEIKHHRDFSHDKIVFVFPYLLFLLFMMFLPLWLWESTCSFFHSSSFTSSWDVVTYPQVSRCRQTQSDTAKDKHVYIIVSSKIVCGLTIRLPLCHHQARRWCFVSRVSKR